MKIHNINYKSLKLIALTGMVLTASSGCYFSKEEDSIRIRFEKEGNPEYADKLYNVLSNLDSNIKNFIEGKDLRVVILEGKISAEEKYQQTYNTSPGKILGYYDKYPDSSANLSVEEFYYRMNRDTLLHEMGHFVDEENGYNY